ncbi:hypothetical protein OSSY52_15390 [Tepiditoga spiralis]|uniref:ChrB C-terminal domain-containing protein n=1 Tax=Tepiditoga spiralis TaxID=2108365 RepID=A0A7G1G4F9_9BACT|nr:chromate resistance protein ChrB domain-containing protein [Tepiditoga spiralis]BBE31398.1 hypothetical protein OSSY52_15390 [Tepiditoga spiralis]
MRWVTRAHVHVDRVACPWLIKRFVDVNAEIFYVARDLVMDIAKKENAIPFDVKDVELGHKDGHCTFISILDKYNLNDPALRALGEVVNAADTGKIESNPYAPGLEAIARGFSLMFPDDYENLEKQFKVYDALYAVLKLEMAKKSK